MNKNNFSSPNSNFINLQEFDDIFHSSSLPKSSRQTSMSLKSKVSSEPPQDFDEDFSAINSLIHQRVNEPSTSQSNSYFKDGPFFDSGSLFRVPKLSSETSNNPINDPQIANILAEPPISANRPEPSYFQMGSNPMPEGWLNLFRSLQSEPPGLSPATGSRQGTKKSLKLSKDFESWDLNASSSWTGSNLTKGEVDMKELEDQSNPYKIKSKKEIEEERKKKEQSGQAQPVTKKPVQQELRHTKSTVEKTTTGSSASVVNKPEESDIHRTKKPSGNYYNESGYNKYNNNGYAEPPQTKSTTPKANLDTPVNKKNTERERYTEPVVPAAKITTPKNVPEKETPAAPSKKTKPQKHPIEEKIPTQSVSKEPMKQNPVVVEKPKVEEAVVKKPKEEVKPEVKAKEHKEIKKEVVKQPEPVIPKPIIEKVTQVKPEKPAPVVEKEKEKEIIPTKQQEPEKVTPVVKEKKQPQSQSQPQPQPQPEQPKPQPQKKVVKQPEPMPVKQPEPVPVKQPEPEPVVEDEEISEPRSSVEQERSTSGGKGQADEEFITIGTSKNKKKGKKADKAESKKQILKETVKKETEKLIQNPFSALQSASNPPPASKETKEIEVVEPKVKEEPAPMPTLQAEHSSSSGTKDKKEKSKKQKKAEKKKAEEAQKAQKAAAVAEVKEEKKEEQPVVENIPVEEKSVPATPPSETTTKGKNKKKGGQAPKIEEIPEVKPVEPENKPASVEEDSAKEDEGEDKTDAAGQPSKSKKKKNKKKKNKNKEENGEDANKQVGSSTTQSKADNRRAAVENDGSTDEDEPGTEKKSEQQFSKSKKKKLKKKAKQQPLFECIRNAENKFLEFLNEYFVEPNGIPDDVAFMEKFKKVLAMQKSMQLELKPAKPSKEVKEIKEIRDPKTKTTIVKERIEEKGPFGETRIKLQVTLRRHNEEEELSEKEKKKKDRRNRSSINEIFENPGDEFDALKKLISEDMGDKRTQNVPSLMNSRQVADFDNVREAIEHVESIVKNKSEVQQIRNRKVETEDLSSLPLHELLERVENRRFRFQEDEEELDCPLTMN